MIKITIQIDGMQCGMCEAHINDVMRREFPVKKVSSSHAKGQTVIITEDEIDDQRLKEAVEETGYEVIAVKREPYEKRGLFSVRHK